MKERIELLIKALESGEYKQTKGGMYWPEKNCFCVAVVACDVYKKETGLGEWHESESANGRYFDFVIGHKRDWIAPPQEVVDWFGFKNKELDESTGGVLMEFNDTHKYSFPRIANELKKSISEKQD